METTELKPINEGKTKRIYPIPGDPARVRVESKNDITAGDGAKHDLIEGKAELATRTTCNVFRLLKACGIPVAFERQESATEFIAESCEMLPFEVVVRREAHGSYLDRNPHLAKGHVFPRLVVEFFLKTHGLKWTGIVSGTDYILSKDDPLMQIDKTGNKIDLYLPGYTSEERKTAPKGALVGQKSFLSLVFDEVLATDPFPLFEQMDEIAPQVFLILEKAWQLQGRKLVDFKIEFGINTKGKLRLADVIDNDSWRVIDESGGYIDKQLYRDGSDLDTVTAKYREVADMTGQFALPKQALIIWRGSEKDDLAPFRNCLTPALVSQGGQSWYLYDREDVLCRFNVQDVTCSVHKQPALAYKLLHQHIQKFPDSVLLAYIGRSNGAGPVLAANSTVPVVTVPAGYKEFPDDVWSSLRTPSSVPVMTVLEPANAMLAALQILALRNPSIYAALRFEQEKRLTNI
jgi:phosphoribosylaminoimidazole carboxylase/phosphoribosylaminoimidazole-succinocarboxamide synthase